MSESISDELNRIDLGDQRLNKRSKHILEALANNPEASINAASDGWGDTLAAYRFFDNQAVTPAQILRPHREATIDRVRQHPVVLTGRLQQPSQGSAARPATDLDRSSPHGRLRPSLANLRPRCVKSCV